MASVIKPGTEIVEAIEAIIIERSGQIPPHAQRGGDPPCSRAARRMAYPRHGLRVRVG